MMLWLYKTCVFNENQRIAQQTDDAYKKRPKLGGKPVPGRRQDNEYSSDEIDNEDSIIDVKNLRKNRKGQQTDGSQA